MPLTTEDFSRAADRLGVDSAAVRAVDEVESAGKGFLKNGEPKILFEAHWFSRFTDGQYNESHPNISSPKWDQSLYVGGEGEHDRLARAADLNRTAALKSASWGRYQILGLNWDKCGYNSLQDFINAMYRSEEDHLEAFVGFVINESLDESLREGDWHAFAREYNGPGYQRNDYARRMKEAYESFKED